MLQDNHSNINTYQSRFGPALDTDSHLQNRSSYVTNTYSRSKRNHSFNPNTQSRSSYISRRSNVVEEQPFPTLSVYDKEGLVSKKEINQEIGLNALERENKELKNELHRLRKIQAGWFGKEKQKVVEKVKVEHHHYLNEKNTLMEEKKILEKDNQNLIQKNQQLQNELDLLNKNKSVNVQNNIVDQVSTQNNQELNTLRTELDQAKEENRRLINQHKLDIQKLRTENNKHSQIQTSRIEQNYNSVLNIKTSLENQLIEKNKKLSELNQQNQDLINQISSLQSEVHNYQTGIYNTNIQVDNSNDSQQIIARYKQKLEEKNIENQQLKNQINNLKERIHQVTLEKQQIQTRSNIRTNDSEKQKLIFDLENLRNQNRFQEVEINKLKDIIYKAKDQPIQKTVHITEEYRNVDNHHKLSNNLLNSNYERSNVQDYNNNSYISNRHQKISLAQQIIFFKINFQFKICIQLCQKNQLKKLFKDLQNMIIYILLNQQ